MSLRQLPKPQAFDRPRGYDWDPPAGALNQWTDGPQVSEADDPNTVSIYGVIGEDYWGEGFTAKRMAGALRAIGKSAVTVNINSPGGDMFEGLAIYNLLRDHPARVTVKVMGVAASAASIIAMSGDDVLMGTGSVLMIHNAWGLVIGNRHDFADAASVFQTFDEAMASIYAARTGLADSVILKMLDGPTRASDGTYMSASVAIDKGFADGQFEGSGDEAAKAVLPDDVMARRRMEAVLAKQGVGRKDRAAMINSLAGPRDATRPGERDAAEFSAGLTRLLDSIRS